MQATLSIYLTSDEGEVKPIVSAPRLMLLTLGFLPAASSLSQSNSMLPPTPNTGVQAPIAATSAGTRDGATRHRARVSYVGGLLSVRADNSSLNGILHDISVATGMKVTGGVVDQRVFGNYGPAEPATVLATLLDGTGTNMLLRETADNGPRELILTPRTGGVTPPSPSAQMDENEDSSEVGTQQQQQQPVASPQALEPTSSNQQRRFGPQSIPQPFNNVLGSPNNTTQSASTIPTVQSVPTDSISTPSVAQPVSGIVDSTNPPPAGSTNFGSSTPTNVDNLGNGTPRTPEQIFQQLQQMRQKSQQQQQTGAGSTPSTPQ